MRSKIQMLALIIIIIIHVKSLDLYFCRQTIRHYNLDGDDTFIVENHGYHTFV